MAQNFFVQIDGIDANCGVAGHAKEIQALSWSHSFNQPTNPTRSSAGGGTVEQANHADFSFTKYIDLSSVPLMKACWSGKTIRSAMFTAYRNDGDELAEYLKVEMTNVIVSNVSIGGGTGDLPTETVTLSYGTVKYTYTPTPAAKGKPLSSKHDLGLQKVE